MRNGPPTIGLATERLSNPIARTPDISYLSSILAEERRKQMTLRFWKKKSLPIKQALGDSISSRFYRALICIRDEPKHARRKAKEALTGPPLWRHLVRALCEIKADPDRAVAIAERALADVRLALTLIDVLREIQQHPKEAKQLASVAVVNGAKAGAR